MVGNKNAFFQALIFTILVFMLGLLAGSYLEFFRADNFQQAALSSEINLLDQQIRRDTLGSFDVSCESAKSGLFNFADKVYRDALLLEEYDSASKLSNQLEILHRKYDLLRVLLWMEAIDVREECGDDFHTVVYFFKYGLEDIDVNSEQIVYSRLLKDLKDEHVDDVLLIPIATNLDIESVEIILNSYGLGTGPLIFVDETIVIDGIPAYDELETIVFENNNG